MKNGHVITFQTEAWAFQRVKDAANGSQGTPNTPFLRATYLCGHFLEVTFHQDEKKMMIFEKLDGEGNEKVTPLQLF